jgi:hypothetical protein
VEAQLADIIRHSTFSFEPGQYCYVQVATIPPTGRYFLVTQDQDEITVVTREEYIGDFEVLDRNKDTYSLIALRVALPFYSVGFLAAVSGAIAAQGLNILIVSTYSKDYLLVRKGTEEVVRNILGDLGFSEWRP